jgi:hypothetical protein
VKISCQPLAYDVGIGKVIIEIISVTLVFKVFQYYVIGGDGSFAQYFILFPGRSDVF